MRGIEGRSDNVEPQSLPLQIKVSTARLRTMVAHYSRSAHYSLIVVKRFLAEHFYVCRHGSEKVAAGDTINV